MSLMLPHTSDLCSTAGCTAALIPVPRHYLRRVRALRDPSPGGLQSPPDLLILDTIREFR